MPRDLAYEARLTPRVRKLIDAYVTARLAARAPGVTRWLNLYQSLEAEPVETEQELRDTIVELKQKARAVKKYEAKHLEEQAWESQAMEIDPDWSPREVNERIYGDVLVWLYHGTSTKLLPKIKLEGLMPTARRTHVDATPGYIYLTAQPGRGLHVSGDARFYALMAARKWGGDPVVLRVIVPWRTLEIDEDDADIKSGRVQYRTTEPVFPDQIKEIDGRRR